MMNRIFLFLFGVFPLSCGLAENVEKISLPAAPILKILPEAAEWTVVFGDPNREKAAGVENTGREIKAKTIVVTKSGATYREAEFGEDGVTLIRWQLDGNEVSVGPKGGTIASPTKGRKDLEEFAWISEKTYTGVAKVAGEDCFIFKEKAVFRDDSSTADMTAAISVARRLPVSLVVDNEYRSYSFSLQGVPALTVPVEVREALDARKKSVGALLRKPSSPPKSK